MDLNKEFAALVGKELDECEELSRDSSILNHLMTNFENVDDSKSVQMNSIKVMSFLLLS